MGLPFVEAIAGSAPALLPALPGAGLPWLDAARRQQLHAFLRQGLPDTRNEAWKYTALRALAQRVFDTGDADAGARRIPARALTLPGVDGPRLVFVNGVLRADLCDLHALPPGLSLQPLSQALSADPTPLRFFLTRDWAHASDAFARLNAAFAADGAVLRVAAGKRIQPPVHLVHIGAQANTELAWHLRHIVELEAGASLSLIEHHIGAGEHAHLGTLVSDVVLRENAALDWLGLQDAAPAATLVRRDSLRLDAGARASVHALELGGAIVRHELSAQLSGEGAGLLTRGVFAPRGRQHLDTRLDIRHHAPRTHSDALWRGVAGQRGRGVFHGAIAVAAGADGTQASLNNKNLLLSPHAEIEHQPVLEIYADEVQAAHGATAGQLDPRSLFYLRTRGIPEVQARALLTLAFCQAVLDDLPNRALREHLNERLIKRLSSDGAAP